MAEAQKEKTGYEEKKQPKGTPVCRYCGGCTPQWSGTGQWSCQVDGLAWSAGYDEDKPAEE